MPKRRLTKTQIKDQREMAALACSAFTHGVDLKAQLCEAFGPALGPPDVQATVARLSENYRELSASLTQLAADLRAEP